MADNTSPGSVGLCVLVCCVDPYTVMWGNSEFPSPNPGGFGECMEPLVVDPMLGVQQVNDPIVTAAVYQQKLVNVLDGVDHQSQALAFNDTEQDSQVYDCPMTSDCTGSKKRRLQDGVTDGMSTAYIDRVEDCVTNDMAAAYTNNLIAEKLKDCNSKLKGTPSVIVETNDINGAGLVAKGGDLMRNDELLHRSKQTSLDRSLIRIRPSEKKLCEALKFYGNSVNRAVFFNDDGEPMQFVRSYIMSGTNVDAYFRKLPADSQYTNKSGKPSLKHEQAVDLVASLAAQNLLKVETRCSFECHAKRSLFEWTTRFAFQAWEVNGRDPGCRVVKSYKWKPSSKDSCYFDLDAAVLKDDELYIAIEVEKAHANSQKKKNAFKKFGIINVQVFADDIIREFLERMSEGLHLSNFVAAHHPNTKSEPLVCSVCDPAQRLRQASRLKLAQMKKKEDDEKEAFLQEQYQLTTLSDVEVGKVVTCFLNFASYATLRGWVGGHLAYRDESGVKVAAFFDNQEIIAWIKLMNLRRDKRACFLIESVESITAKHVQIFEDSDRTKHHERASLEIGAKIVRVNLACDGPNLPNYTGYVAPSSLAGPLSQNDIEILVNAEIDKRHWADITGLSEEDINNT